MDVGSDKGSDSDSIFEDVKEDVVLDAQAEDASADELHEDWLVDGPDAVDEAFDDDAADGNPVEEAPMKLPRNPSDPTPEAGNAQ